MRFGKRGQVTHIDAAAQTLIMGDGSKIKYGKLLSTIPLDITLTWLERKDLAERLTYSSRYLYVCIIERCQVIVHLLLLP